MTPPPAPELESTNCPLCGCDESSLHMTAVDRQCGIPGEYLVVRCGQCQHLYMNPRPTAETLHLCYPPGYGPHQTPPPATDADHGTVASGESLPVSPATTPWYLRYLPLRYVPGLKRLYYWLVEDLGQPLPKFPGLQNGQPPKAFELGCSTGAYLGELVDAGWNVTGAEPDEAASQKCRDAGLNVHTGVLSDVPSDDCEFDCVAGWMVVEHTIDPVGTLAEFHRILKPDGQLLFSVPNVGCWEPAAFQSSWYLWEAPRHLHHFTPRMLRRILLQQGFAEIRILHQRNVLNVIGSLGILLKRWKLTAGLGERLLRYPDSPRLAIQLLLAPVAHLLSFLRQGGRLTVLARKATAPSDSAVTDSATTPSRHSAEKHQP